MHTPSIAAHGIQGLKRCLNSNTKIKSQFICSLQNFWGNKPYLANFSTASLVLLYPFMYIYTKLVSHEEQDTDSYKTITRFYRARVNCQYENSNFYSLTKSTPAFQSNCCWISQGCAFRSFANYSLKLASRHSQKVKNIHPSSFI